MKKTFISIALNIILLMSLMPSVVFADYMGASAWAAPELDQADGYGLITDRVKDNVSGNITRQEFAEIVVRLYELIAGKNAEAGTVSFTDTTNEEILKAANLGMVMGVGSGKFAPDNLITREQMATILLRALKVINPTADFSADGTAKFSDDSIISGYARDSVYYSSKNNLLKGVGGNQFDPQGKSSREAAIIVCLRANARYGQAQNPSLSQDSQQTGPILSNAVLAQNIEKLNSYRRIIRTIITSPESEGKWESIKEFAYIKNPLSRYFRLYFPDSGGSYAEETIIGDKLWEKSSKDGDWTLDTEWYYDPPVSFKYDISTQPYTIDYSKLKYSKTGTEKVNGINCIKYTVSGEYSDELTYKGSSPKYPITLAVSGTVWIADDSAIKTALIRQRITVKTDITIGKEHSASEDIIEDDIMDVNATVISPPTNVNMTI